MPEEQLPTVYLETSVISYLAARPSRDLLVAAHQEVTHRWWIECRVGYQLFISQLVEDEVKQGDPIEIQNRLALIGEIVRLELSEDVVELAEFFMRGKALPRNAENDSLHIALATLRGIDFVITWNMRHMANATIRRRIEKLCEAVALIPPVICTPEELLSKM